MCNVVVYDLCFLVGTSVTVTVTVIAVTVTGTETGTGIGTVTRIGIEIVIEIEEIGTKKGVGVVGAKTATEIEIAEVLVMETATMKAEANEIVKEIAMNDKKVATPKTEAVKMAGVEVGKRRIIPNLLQPKNQLKLVLIMRRSLKKKPKKQRK
jgi:hypothetical protein